MPKMPKVPKMPKMIKKPKMPELPGLPGFVAAGFIPANFALINKCPKMPKFKMMKRMI
jgi:hypothetical protein